MFRNFIWRISLAGSRLCALSSVHDGQVVHTLLSSYLKLLLALKGIRHRLALEFHILVVLIPVVNNIHLNLGHMFFFRTSVIYWT